MFRQLSVLPLFNFELKVFFIWDLPFKLNDDSSFECELSEPILDSEGAIRDSDGASLESEGVILLRPFKSIDGEEGYFKG